MNCTRCTRNPVATGGPGPADYCDQCRLECHRLGVLVTAIPEKAAHVILGAFGVASSEGYSDVSSRPFADCKEVDETENTIVQLLYELHPDVVKNECYAHIPSVQKALK